MSKTPTALSPAAEASISGDWVFSGGVEKQTAMVTARATTKAHLGEPIRLSGYVRRATRDVPVAIYCREAGKREPVEPTLTVTAASRDGLAMFAAMLPGFRHNVLITAEVGALTDDTLPGADQLTVKVRAATRLAVKRRGGRLVLTARVSPKDATARSPSSAGCAAAGWPPAQPHSPAGRPGRPSRPRASPASVPASAAAPRTPPAPGRPGPSSRQELGRRAPCPARRPSGHGSGVPTPPWSRHRSRPRRRSRPSTLLDSNA